MHYYLGADLGATKTHTLIVDETGRALGFGESGPGNHESVGYDGMFQSMQDGMEQALRAAGLKKEEITGAGFGVAGYDWASEYADTASVIERLGLQAPYKFVNDAVLGLVAGSEAGWGVVVVSGTGSNCRGWDRDHKREGRVTGHGVLMGEGAGGSELMHRCMQIIGYSWTKRLPQTALADAVIAYVGAKDLEDLMRDKKFGTVGAVALDQHGNLAAATSTGGMTNKNYGRIGDTPMIGIGNYANNSTCAISCTGHGELFIRAVAAYDVSALMEYRKLSLDQAMNEVVMVKLKNIGGEGGMIGIDASGNLSMIFNSEGMYRAMKHSGGKQEISIFR